MKKNVKQAAAKVISTTPHTKRLHDPRLLADIVDRIMFSAKLGVIAEFDAVWKDLSSRMGDWSEADMWEYPVVIITFGNA